MICEIDQVSVMKPKAKKKRARKNWTLAAEIASHPPLQETLARIQKSIGRSTFDGFHRGASIVGAEALERIAELIEERECVKTKARHDGNQSCYASGSRRAARANARLAHR
jgi:hypothetical protein